MDFIRYMRRLCCGIAGVEQSEVLRDKEIIEEKLKKEIPTGR